MRRDEVAGLAGIGVSWYTLIEQGRDVNVSLETVVRIAEALRLDPFRMSHLLSLALPDIPPVPRQSVDHDVLERLQSILDTQVLNPAHVVDDAFTAVAWNALAERFYGFRHEAAGFERNLIWRLFNESVFAAFFSDWDDTVANLVGLLRYNYARAAGDSDYETLVHELYRTKPVFRRLWDTYHVHRRQTEICRFNHALIGDVTLRLLYSTAHVEPPLHLVFLTPADDSSRKALERLERMDGAPIAASLA